MIIQLPPNSGMRSHDKKKKVKQFPYTASYIGRVYNGQVGPRLDFFFLSPFNGTWNFVLTCGIYSNVAAEIKRTKIYIYIYKLYTLMLIINMDGKCNGAFNYSTWNTSQRLHRGGGTGHQISQTVYWWHNQKESVKNEEHSCGFWHHLHVVYMQRMFQLPLMS